MIVAKIFSPGEKKPITYRFLNNKIYSFWHNDVEYKIELNYSWLRMKFGIPIYYIYYREGYGFTTFTGGRYVYKKEPTKYGDDEYKG